MHALQYRELLFTVLQKKTSTQKEKKKRKRTMYLNCNGGVAKQKNSFKCYTVIKKKPLVCIRFVGFCVYIFVQCTAFSATSELIFCIQNLVFGLCTVIFLVFFLSFHHFCLHLHHRYYILVKVCCHYQMHLKLKIPSGPTLSISYRRSRWRTWNVIQKEKKNVSIHFFFFYDTTPL